MFKDNFVMKRLTEIKLLPLYTVTNLCLIDDLAEVLLQCNIPIIEVAFRSELGARGIKKLSQYDELIVGAGTIRTLEQAKIAVASGAKFIVSPAIIPEVIEYCLKIGVPIFPGAITPTEIQKGVDFGLDVIKFFPANIYGGLNAIKTLSAPFYDVKFIPTGGIDESNYLEYLANDKVVAVGGSFIISEKLLVEHSISDNILKINNLVSKIN